MQEQKIGCNSGVLPFTLHLTLQQPPSEPLCESSLQSLVVSAYSSHWLAEHHLRSLIHNHVQYLQKCPPLSTRIQSLVVYFFPGPLYSAQGLSHILFLRAIFGAEFWLNVFTFHGDFLSGPSWLLFEIPIKNSRLTLDSGNYYRQMLQMLMS